MKLKLIIVSMVLVLICVGCSSSGLKANEDYSYELSTIETEDKKVIKKWMKEVDNSQINVYGLIDENEKRNVEYFYSNEYNDAKVTQVGKKIKVIFSNPDEIEEKDVLVKINYKPTKVTEFSWDEE